MSAICFRPGSRERDEVGRHVLAAAGGREVDDRAGAADGHRLVERADFQRHVDAGGKARVQLEALPHQRIETGELEAELVGAARQVDEAVPALAVGDRRDLLHLQRRARRGDGRRRAARRRIRR